MPSQTASGRVAVTLFHSHGQSNAKGDGNDSQLLPDDKDCQDG